MNTQMLVTSLFGISLLAACSGGTVHSDNESPCSTEGLESLSYRKLEGGYYGSSATRTPSQRELMGKWIMIGRYYPDPEGEIQDVFEPNVFKDVISQSPASPRDAANAFPFQKISFFVEQKKGKLQALFDQSRDDAFDPWIRSMHAVNSTEGPVISFRMERDEEFSSKDDSSVRMLSSGKFLIVKTRRDATEYYLLENSGCN